MGKGKPRREGRVRTNPRAPSSTIQPDKSTHNSRAKRAHTKADWEDMHLCPVIETNPSTGRPYARCLRSTWNYETQTPVPCYLHPDGKARPL